MENSESNLQAQMPMPRVSWIICAHYVNKFMQDAIQSCLNQSFSSFEILIIANGSKAYLVEEFVDKHFYQNSRIRVITTQIQGLIFSLNLGVNFAKGEFIGRMDFDDISYPDRLINQVRFLDENPLVSVVGSSFDLIDDDGIIRETILCLESHQKIVKALIYKNPICHPTVLIRKKVLVEAGGYMGGVHAEDYDLWLRLYEKKDIYFENLPISLLGYRIDGGEARGAMAAYASQAATQVRSFLLGNGFRWIIACFISIAKLIKMHIKKTLKY
jgi:glycosyltransferase involved in cell wall biosynthesis